MPHDDAVMQEPDFADLLKDLWRAKWLLAFGAIVGLIGGAFFLATAIPQYKVSMMVGPAARTQGADMISFVPDSSTMSMRQNVNSIGAQGSNDFIRFEHILQGPSVAAMLVNDPKIIEGYNKTRRFAFQSKGRENKVSAEELSAYLQDHVVIENVELTPLRRLVFEHPDKDFAIYLLNKIYKTADALIQNDMRAQSEERAAYLHNALVRTDHPDHRRALTALLMEQEHLKMVLDMDEPYAAIIAEPPTAGYKPAWPKAWFVWAVFLCGGMFVFYSFHRMRVSLQP